MRRRARDTNEASGFGKIGTDRLTWIGFVLVVVGWAALIGGAACLDLWLAKSKWTVGPSLHADVVDMTKCLIASGFALAVIGALRSGFGTLNGFFGAVLSRSAQRDTGVTRQAEPIVERPAPAPVAGKRRPYRTFADGSVEVDTIVGTRLFKTMAEARDFI